MTTRIVLVTSCLLAMATLVASECSLFPNQTRANPVNVTPSLQLGEVTGLIIGIGGFALIIAVVFIVVRKSVYHDTDLLDTFFDAGGNNNFAVVACLVVSWWLWSTQYLPTFDAVHIFGIVGQFWQAAATSIQLLLFSIIAAEFRIKAPGAKTYLQVIRCRFGTAAHVIVMIFAVFVNLFLMGLTLSESTRLLSALTTGISKEVIAVLLSLAASVFTIVGGVGGGMYMAYFACAGVLGIVLTYFINAFLVMTDSTLHQWGFVYGDKQVVDTVCDIVQCGRTSKSVGNLDNSPLTFFTSKGMLAGVYCLLSGLSYMFPNQAFWTSASTARPRHAVWGFLTAGIAFFAIPFTLSFTFGMGHWVTSTLQGYYLPTTMKQDRRSLIQVSISQLILGETGDYMMFALVVTTVIIACSSQINSLSAIFMYDIYQPYIIRPPSLMGTTKDQEVAEYLWYNRRSVFVRHAVTIFFSILTFPAAVILMSIQLDFIYKVLFVAIVVGSCVLPVSLSITWHRVTGLGVSSGIISGLVAGIGTWLTYAMSFPGGLTDFVGNTGRQEVMIAAMAASLGVAGIVCIMISLCCGGLDSDRDEEQEWEKCRILDNPVKPWVAQYAVDSVDFISQPGLPSYQQVRYEYRSAEMSAYILGILLTVVVGLMWPALMLLAGVFTCSAFTVWSMLVIVLAVISTLYLGLMPPLTEIVQLCTAKPLPKQEQQIVEAAVIPQPDDNIMYVTSADLAPAIEVLECRDDVPDDESSIVDNSDGLNVLSDPRKPLPSSARKPAATLPASKSSGPVVYPLSSSTSLRPCAGCGPPPQPYCVSATDIPFNGPGSTGSPTGRAMVHVD